MTAEDEAEVTLYKTGRVAALLDSNPKTIRRLIADGKLPAVEINGQYRIRHADLKDFIEARYGVPAT